MQVNQRKIQQYREYSQRPLHEETINYAKIDDDYKDTSVIVVNLFLNEKLPKIQMLAKVPAEPQRTKKRISSRISGLARFFNDSEACYFPCSGSFSKH